MRLVRSPVVALSLLLTPIAAASAACYTPAETAAVQVRILQSELMVAALACRDSNPELEMIAKYNLFVQRFSERLVSNSRVLQGYFKKNYGAESNKRHDTFITAIANDASTRSMTAGGFCSNAATLFREVASLERRDLETFSASHVASNGAVPIAACASETVNKGAATAPRR